MKSRFDVPIEPRKDDGAVPATQPPPVVLRPDGLTTAQRIDAMHTSGHAGNGGQGARVDAP